MGKLMSESCSCVLTAVCIASSVLLFSAGCASGDGSGSVPANTHATLLITATNNTKIPIFKFNIQTLTLLADDGTSVPILTAPQLVELGSISGVARPLCYHGRSSKKLRLSQADLRSFDLRCNRSKWWPRNDQHRYL